MAWQACAQPNLNHSHGSDFGSRSSGKGGALCPHHLTMQAISGARGGYNAALDALTVGFESADEGCYHGSAGGTLSEIEKKKRSTCPF